jgi:arsenical pump membrane protein
MSQDLFVTLLIYVSTIFLILFGKDISSKKFRWLHLSKIVYGSIFGLIILINTTSASWGGFVASSLGKKDLILLILTFAYLAKSLDYSGLYSVLSLKIVEYARRNTTRLLIFMYILTSALTYATSNDIVILSMTPIILYVGYHAGIKNLVPYLITQFVAANTLSMGLYIGSPTNIVIADAVGWTFKEYFLNMLFPSVASFMTTLIVLIFVFTRLNLFGNKLEAKYEIPDQCEDAHFSKEMGLKVILFGLGLALMAIREGDQIPLWHISGSLALLFLLLDVAYFCKTDRNLPDLNPDDDNSKLPSPATLSRYKFFKEAVGSPPYEIIPFVFTFFYLVSWIGDLGGISQIAGFVKQIDNENLFAHGIAFAASSGIIVNLLNDIPATVFLSDLLASLHFDSELKNKIAILCILVGVNIGCYITHIGALAGIMWFSILRKFKLSHSGDNGGVRYDVILPSKFEFFSYGCIVFPVVTIVTATVCVLQVLITGWC